MTSSRKKSTPQKTSNLPIIDATPLGDLRLARQLLQQALDKGEIGSACLFAIAASKLVHPVQTWGIEKNELLTKPAVRRLAQKMVEAIYQTTQCGLITEKITNTIADEIGKRNEE